MTGSIICGVDDSRSAKGAARVARRLSEELGLRLVFVSVVDPASSEGEISVVNERLHQFAGATESDRGAGWLVEVGHPADRLVAVAEKEAATLIVVGSTGARTSLLGSISADVSRRAPCPIVVVAPGTDRSLVTRKDEARVAARVSGGLANGDAAPKPDAHYFAGGIVRFGLGGRSDS